MNYTELRAAIADFLNRDDLTATIPTFIVLAEAQFQRTVRHWRGETRATITLAGRFTDLPADYLEMARIAVEGPLSIVTSDRMDALHESNPIASASPLYYAIAGDQIEAFPSSTADAEIRYYAKIPALSDAVPTNWLLDIAPDAYLYGSLIQSAPYLQEDARISTWASLHEAAINGVNADGRNGRYGTKLVMRNA